MRSGRPTPEKDNPFDDFILFLMLSSIALATIYTIALRTIRWFQPPISTAKRILQQLEGQKEAKTETLPQTSHQVTEKKKVSHSTSPSLIIKDTLSFFTESAASSTKKERKESPVHQRATKNDWKTDAIQEQLTAKRLEKSTKKAELAKKNDEKVQRTARIATETVSQASLIVAQKTPAKPTKPKTAVKEPKPQRHSLEQERPVHSQHRSSYFRTQQHIYIDRVTAAIPAFEHHAAQLCQFPNDGLAGIDNQISSLAFMYHFHRYNLIRLFLYQNGTTNPLSTSESDTSLGFMSARTLRTMLVHGAGKIQIHYDTLTATKMYLEKFIWIEVRNLINRKQAELAKLEARTTGSHAYVASNTLDFSLNHAFVSRSPLCLLLSDQHDLQHVHDAMHNDHVFTTWLTETQLPLLSNLFSRSGLLETDAQPMLSNPNVDALKMSIIICGEYCDHERLARMRQSHQLSHLIPFLTQCKTLRNRLSHDVENVSDAQLMLLSEHIRALMEAAHTQAAQVTTLLLASARTHV
jgi:hypothetical protein